MFDKAVLPTEAFHSRNLDLVDLPFDNFFRVHKERHRDPLGWGPGSSRFSDCLAGTSGVTPFGTVYLGEDVEVCVLEAIIRDSGVGASRPSIPISEKNLKQWRYATIGQTRTFRLLDLREGKAVKERIPTDVIRATSHGLSQQWARAIHDHKDQPDGILFPSRLNSGTNVAVFDRALSGLKVADTFSLWDDQATLGMILDKYDIALI